MFLHLSSKDCVQSHPDNHAWDFTIDVGKYVTLSGEWEVALTEMLYDGARKMDLYVFSDICSPTYVIDNCLPLLRIVNKPNIFQKPYFVPVSRNDIARIRIYIRTRNNNIPPFQPKSLRCTLQLKTI